MKVVNKYAKWHIRNVQRQNSNDVKELQLIFGVLFIKPKMYFTFNYTEPGYKGCYHPEDLPQQNGYIFESTSQCVSSCRTNTRKALAIMNGKQCFCSIADEVNLPDITPEDHSTCIQNTRGTQQVINSLVNDGQSASSN